MKIDLVELKKSEKEHREKINKEYEKIGKKLINKFYKREYTDQWKEEQIDYLYLHSNNGSHLSGIEFNKGRSMISRVGHSIDYFENWEEVGSEELMDIKFELIKFFHLSEIFKGYL